MAGWKLPGGGIRKRSVLNRPAKIPTVAEINRRKENGSVARFSGHPGRTPFAPQVVQQAPPQVVPPKVLPPQVVPPQVPPTPVAPQASRNPDESALDIFTGSFAHLNINDDEVEGSASSGPNTELDAEPNPVTSGGPATKLSRDKGIGELMKEALLERKLRGLTYRISTTKPISGAFETYPARGGQFLYIGGFGRILALDSTDLEDEPEDDAGDGSAATGGANGGAACGRGANGGAASGRGANGGAASGRGANGGGASGRGANGGAASGRGANGGAASGRGANGGGASGRGANGGGASGRGANGGGASGEAGAEEEDAWRSAIEQVRSSRPGTSAPPKQFVVASWTREAVGGGKPSGLNYGVTPIQPNRGGFPSCPARGEFDTEDEEEPEATVPEEASNPGSMSSFFGGARNRSAAGPSGSGSGRSPARDRDGGNRSLFGDGTGGEDEEGRPNLEETIDIKPFVGRILPIYVYGSKRCEFCGKRINNRQKLKNHRVAHLGPFVAPCGRSYKYPHDMHKHLRTCKNEQKWLKRLGK